LQTFRWKILTFGRLLTIVCLQNFMDGTTLDERGRSC
jgi:hypothetical protein